MEFGDAKLVYRLNHKDDKVWEELFNSYYESLCNHAYRILLDESVTEDIVQEVFVKLWDGRAVFENEKALSYFIETGVGDSGDSYLTVLQNFDLIYKKYKNEIKNDEEYLLKLAVTTSWAFAIASWATSRKVWLFSTKSLLRTIPNMRRMS